MLASSRAIFYEIFVPLPDVAVIVQKFLDRLETRFTVERHFLIKLGLAVDFPLNGIGKRQKVADIT